MDQWYEADGVRFGFPEAWELQREQSDGELTLTVSGEGTTFWSLSLVGGCPPALSVIAAVVESLQEEYEDLDIYEVDASLCGFPTVGRQVEFICLELINTATLRAFETPDCTVLLYCQGTDHELAETGDLLERITASLELSGSDHP